MASAVKLHSYLVSKVNFHLEILPLVKLGSSLLPHLFMIFVAFIVAWSEGFKPGLHSLQIIYYLLMMNLLLLGIGWLTCSTSIFVSDVGKIVSVFIQFGFFLTPLFWNINSIPDRFQPWLKANPAFYLVSGYRDSIINGVYFWERPLLTLYYWLVLSSFLLIGITVFRRLKPHFAEVA